MPVSLLSTSCGRARILVVQHSEHAPGGNFCKGFADRDARLTVIRPFEHDDVPRETHLFDGLVVLGGPQSAFDDTARLFERITRRIGKEKVQKSWLALARNLAEPIKKASGADTW